jgi:hypothetical protein
LLHRAALISLVIEMQLPTKPDARRDKFRFLGTLAGIRPPIGQAEAFLAEISRSKVA